jgi:hypothetical protein
LTITLFVSPHASSKPDGLEKVALDQGFAGDERAHALENAPTAGYQVRGVDDPGLSTAAAGAIGVGVTFVLVSSLLFVARRAKRGRADRSDQLTTTSAS